MAQCLGTLNTIVISSVVLPLCRNSVLLFQRGFPYQHQSKLLTVLSIDWSASGVFLMWTPADAR